MKRIFLYFSAALAMVATGCQEKLVEQPKSILTPGFIETRQGWQMAYDACYAGTRNLWGTQDYFTMTVLGTDEFITGIDGNNDINKYSSNYNPTLGLLANVWKSCYTFINTCNGVINNAPKITGVDETLKNRMVAEVKFLRANYYFVLVQFWGDVTLNKHFQTTATTSATRQPLAEVYDLIVEDLNAAIPLLPLSPKTDGVLPGKATRAAAMHLLAKVHMARAGSKAKKADDYTKAHTLATELIKTVAPSGGLALLEDFGKVFAEGNEENIEVLWTVQHTANLPYNGPNNSSGQDNVLNHMWVPKYEDIAGMQRDVKYGRPYIRAIPTRWITDTVFNNQSIDTRFRKSFQTMWLSNNPNKLPLWPNPLPPGAPAGAQPGKPKFQVGDTAIFMPLRAATDAQIAASRYLLVPPNKYSTSLSPALTKYFDTKRADMNYPSIRPVIVWRLAETYLIAAEALLMDGRPGDAVEYINAIRRRATYPSATPQALDITAANVTLDFILDERTRELCGELTRWLDLVRTGQLLNRVRLHSADGRANISAKHVLRPIPQSQIDAVTTGPKYPQNELWDN
ncbi:RagB/SusD family nutrient uptake outer membrane protein [Chitinophaga lutea]|uniref:RagB/SusD family nutrient uptake outer membrane protein n=1 Tax=Chitinophaga lutea TaxID=2488634 RepID=A0A3N4Q9S4_9BACT|nr:RagB/SusD family nutrient uptake outer membrane protein [Chitinophaga lutea]RPE12750.1 RagB/SusD family nutrient uptake outer membrane protein [Chitinophaga lutea]